MAREAESLFGDIGAIGDTRQDPPSKPLLKLILLIPGDKDRMIQDKILLRRQSRCTFVADG